MPRTRYNFFIDDDLLAGLRARKVDTGIPESEQIRRAIALWLKTAPFTQAPVPRAQRRRKTGRRS